MFHPSPRHRLLIDTEAAKISAIKNIFKGEGERFQHVLHIAPLYIHIFSFNSLHTVIDKCYTNYVLIHASTQEINIEKYIFITTYAVMFVTSVII